MAVALAAAVSAVDAQQIGQREPHIAYVYPAGGRAGTTFDAVIGGQFLDGASGVRVFGGGVTCVVRKHIKALNQQQANAVRNNIEKLLALEQAGQKDPAKKKEAETLRKQILETLKAAGIEELSLRALQEYRRKMTDPKRQVNPALSETVEVSLTLAPDTPAGNRDFRLQTPAGLSNPLVFQVGRWAECREQEPNDRTADKGLKSALPAMLNGQILPGDVDRFQFSARKGERIVAAVAARALIPYLADAVPGWFQATLALRKAGGRELAYADDYRYNPDPVLCFDIPEDGAYELELKDAIFRGREDFVYRIALGAFPFVTGAFPAGGRTGETVNVTLEGWNLATNRQTIKLAGSAPGVLPDAVGAGAVGAGGGRLPFAVDTLPESLEREPNDTPRQAQPLAALPLTVNGRIERAGDRDLYRFKGRANDALVAEIHARRLGSPLDAVLTLMSEDGKVVAVNDDSEDKGAGLSTHHADPRLQVTLPKDGVYLLGVADSQRQGGGAYTYRLRAGVPQPDFALRVTPSAVNARTGATVPISVFAVRHDGFAGDIRLTLKGAPDGFELAGGWVPAGQDKARLTLTLPRVATKGAAPLVLEGRATIGGREVCRAAVPAEDLMQAFFYRHLVPAQGDWLATAVDTGRWRPPVKLLTGTPVKLPVGGQVHARYGISPFAPLKEIQASLSDPPEGIRIVQVKPEGSALDILLESDAAKCKPGLKGNLIIETFMDREPKPQEGKPKLGKQRVPLGVIPALPFELVERHAPAAGNSP